MHCDENNEEFLFLFTAQVAEIWCLIFQNFQMKISALLSIVVKSKHTTFLVAQFITGQIEA